jgi:hypothetical protein
MLVGEIAETERRDCVVLSLEKVETNLCTTVPRPSDNKRKTELLGFIKGFNIVCEKNVKRGKSKEWKAVAMTSRRGCFC